MSYVKKRRYPQKAGETSPTNGETNPILGQYYLNVSKY